MTADRLPAVLPNGAVSQQLKVLALAPKLKAVASKAGAHVHAMYRLLLDARDGAGRLDTQIRQERGHDVDHVMELRTHRIGRRHKARPLDNQRRADTTAVGLFLVPLERGITYLSPTG